LDQFARINLGYHGCKSAASVEFARELLNGIANVADWQPSDNPYDWLGRGIYFWEHGPERARQWAGDEGIVIGAVVQLGRCFDLTDVNNTRLLRVAYDTLVEEYRARKLVLPSNEGRDLKLRKLDCLVINRFMTAMENDSGKAEETPRYQTVRCAFEEGDDAFPGSMLKTETHIQVAVRDPSCILGVFRPNL
jgi:hypothetical protein